MEFDGTAVMRVINDENSPVFEISWRDSYRPLTAPDQLGYAWNRIARHWVSRQSYLLLQIRVVWSVIRHVNQCPEIR